VCLIGPNGPGKSTLMRTLAAMQPPIAGQVLLGDADLFALAPQERARLGTLEVREEYRDGRVVSLYRMSADFLGVPEDMVGQEGRQPALRAVIPPPPGT
jgi:ATPase subunit of ABC transporter with duplicated ATPase domains